MAWDGSGNYTRTNGTNTGSTVWADDAAAAVKITTARHDTHDQDIATAIDACLTQNNESKPTADFAPNVTATYDLGTTTLKWEDFHINGIGYFHNSANDVSLSGVSGAVIIGGDGTGQHIAIDSNEIMSKSDATTASDAVLDIQKDGGTLRLGFSTDLTELDIDATSVTINGLEVRGSNVALNTKVIDIGDWNMDTTANVSVAHGLTLSKIRSINVIIRSDTGAVIDDLSSVPNSGMSVPAVTADATNVTLEREGTGYFDSTDHDSTSYNRGWITIQYTD